MTACPCDIIILETILDQIKKGGQTILESLETGDLHQLKGEMSGLRAGDKHGKLCLEFLFLGFSSSPMAHSPSRITEGIGATTESMVFAGQRLLGDHARPELLP